MEKINVVYIGSKAQKKDTVTGSRLVFPRNVPVPTEADIAYQLLAFSSVFIRDSEMGDFAERAKAEEAEKQRLAEEEAKRVAATLKANSFELKIGEQIIDIGKYTTAQLLTLCESEELGIEKGAQEKVDALRQRVKDALLAKYPESDSEENGEG